MKNSVGIAVFLIVGVFCIPSMAEDWQQPMAEVSSSCYADQLEEQTPLIKRGLLVLVDNTVEFDQGIREHAFKMIMDFMSERDRQGGSDRVFIMSFSHHGSGRFKGIRQDWRLEPSPTDTGGIPRGILRSVQRCLDDSQAEELENIRKVLEEVYTESDSDIPKTELMWTLKKTSEEVIPALRAEETFLLIVSDMLENSDITSFYRNKVIDPTKEMQKVEKSDAMADYPGTRIYVVGAGYLAKNGEAMRKVKSFWRWYFERSGGQLCEYGDPYPYVFRSIGWCRAERSAPAQ